MNRFLTVMLGFCTGIFLGGCYSYPKPPVATEGSSFLNRKIDKSDDLLRDIRMLTLEDAQRIAVANNPNYISVYHAVNAARMRYYQALGAWSPTVTASFELSDSNSWTYSNWEAQHGSSYLGDFNTSTTVKANWVVFNGFARLLDTKIASVKFDYQKAIDEDTCRQLIFSVAQAYDNILLAQEQKVIAETNMRFQIECLRETELKHQVGTAALSEVLNFRIQANKAETDYVKADYSYQTAVFALSALMGYPDGKLPGGIMFPKISSKFADRLDTVEVYLDTALANRPDLRSYRELSKVADYTYLRSFSTYYPTVSVYTHFRFTTQNKRYHGDEQCDKYYVPRFTYGFNAEWLLFDGFTRYNKVREAKANLATAQFNVANKWLSVVSEVRSAYARYEYCVRTAQICEKTLADSVAQRDLVAKEYEAGNIGITRLNEVQKDLVSAQTTLANAYVEIHTTKYQLDSVTGQNIVGFYTDADTRYKAQ